MWFYDIHLFTYRASEIIEWPQLADAVKNLIYRNDLSNILQEVKARFNTTFPAEILFTTSNDQNHNQPVNTPFNPNKEKDTHQNSRTIGR